jgi:hypothetical protein
VLFMLPLLRTSDRIDLVASTDPSVVCDDGPVRWLSPAECTTVKGDALVMTVRPMRASEVLRLRSDSPAAVSVDACIMCVTRAKAPGLDETAATALTELLDRLPPAELAALGGAIFELSLAPPDPIGASV